MRLLTVSTESTVSFELGRLLTRIWKATVRREPAGWAEVGPEPGEPVGPLVVVEPSGTMAKPEGSRAT